MESSKHFKLVFGLLIAILVLSAGYYVIFQDSWFDEATNSYKPWLTAEKLAYPFQDFVEKHPPVTFYLQAGWQGWFGPSILAYRWLSLILLLGLAFLLYDSLRRVGGKWLGLFGLALLVFHPFVVGKLVTASPFALIGVCSFLSVWFLQIENWPIRRRVILSAVAISLAFLSRYNMLPALVLLWLFVLLRYRWRYFGLAVISSLAAIFVLEIPYLWLDPEYALSFFFVMFGPLASVLPLDLLPLLPPTAAMTPSSLFGYFLNESRLKLVLQVFTTLFPFIVLVLTGILFVLVEWRHRLRSFARSHPLFLFGLAVIVSLFLAHFFFGPNRHKMNLLYFVPFLIWVAAYSAHLLTNYLREAGVWSKASRPFIVLAIASFLVTPISVALSGNDIIFFNRWNYQDTDLKRIKRGGDYLASLTTTKDLILTIDNPDHVFLAGRLMVPERINRHDTFTDSPDEKLLARFNRYNTEMFLRWLKQDADIFVFQKGTLFTRLEPIADKRGPEWLVAEVEKIVAERYQLLGRVAGVYPRKEERGDGVLEIYRHVK
ncbi:MAG: glycosyltransferase family 39 protein [Patescibacteria group bacterium]